MSLKPLSAILALIAAVGTTVPASAQGYDMRSRNQPRVITVPASQLPDIGRPYSLRVTTGSHKQTGWEQDLIQGNPNLKHWTWIGVGAADQAYLRVAPGDTGKTPVQRPKTSYARPNHVPLPMVTRYAPKENPQTVITRRRMASSNPTVANSSISGRVRVPRVVSETAAPAETLSYGGSYGDVSGRLRAPAVPSSSDSRDVYGKLVTRGVSH